MAKQVAAAVLLLIGLLSACGPSPTTPGPSPTAAPTATPTPTPVGGIDPNATPRTDSVVDLNARHPAEEHAPLLGRFATATGVAVRAGTADDRFVVALEGATSTSVLCEPPIGLMEPRELYGTLPSGGLPVLVAGRVSALRSDERLVLVDCTVLKTGREVVPRSVAKLPAITNVFQGWGLFWAWASFAGLGYLLALLRRRTAPRWLLAAFILSHTAGMATLYAFFGSLVLPYYNGSGSGSLAAWPLVLAFID